jgi:hypothetical protein
MLRILPTDGTRQVTWRISDRRTHQRLVQSARAVARGPIARLLTDGARRSDGRTPGIAALLEEFDRAGLTTLHVGPQSDGLVEAPETLALALVAFELAWVDAGAAASVMATHLALAIVCERGTPDQRALYLARMLPGNPGGERAPWRGACALTGPIPYLGEDSRLLDGRMRVADWQDGREPMLLVEKHGRFIANMEFANFVLAAVEPDDERITCGCIVILEETDPGTFDRGTPTQRIVRQLSPTSDPTFNVTVPASRILGGYTIGNGRIVPRHGDAEVTAAALRRTRVAAELMGAARLLSAVEPVLRYQRARFHCADSVASGPLGCERRLPQYEDALDRLVDVWATGEASASFGFATARLLDELGPMEQRKAVIFAGHRAEHAQTQAFSTFTAEAAACVKRSSLRPEWHREEEFVAVESSDAVRDVLLESLANVLCPAVQLWNREQGAAMMREAVSLVGEWGAMEECPGFLDYKWIDTQFAAGFDEPHSVQRHRLSIAMRNEAFLAQFRQWIGEMRAIANERPGTGACSIATAMQLWLWTVERLPQSIDASGSTPHQGNRPEVTLPLADALCWLLATRFQILDVLELDASGHTPERADAAAGCIGFLSDLCHVQAARSAGEVGRICAALVYGCMRHPSWDDADGRCCGAEDMDELEGLIPGIAALARAYADVIEADGSHVRKAGPCAEPHGLEPFARLRSRLDKCLSGAQLAKDRATETLTKIVIPDTPDYPA